MAENWIPIINYEGYYEISDLGRVRRIIGITHRKESYLKAEVVKRTGYCRITLSKTGKVQRFFLHRLVLLCFKGYSKLNVDHLNSIKQDNSLSNLQYLTQRENISKYTKTKKSTSQFTGVWFVKKNRKWASSICILGVSKHLGVYETEIEAHNAYQTALNQIVNDN